jgi:NRE family putative nickel resistance protein-like MFS transporter
MKLITQLIIPFKSLQNKTFARLYWAETISLIGDACTWLGIALLAYEIAGKQSATILATALTLRVIAFVLFAPFAGIMADKFDRKKILYFTHFFRMIIVGSLPFVHQEWQIYVLVFSLNIFNAFFTPTYKAVIPQVIKDKEKTSQAISLSSSTYMLLGVLGPGIAGGLAAFMGIREIFFVDALSFIIAGILIVTLPGKLSVSDHPEEEIEKGVTWSEITKGTILLFKGNTLRFPLLMEFVTAICGAQILVNTVGYVEGSLNLGRPEYGIVMACFGIGATIAAFSISIITKYIRLPILIIAGTIVIAISIIPANHVSFSLLLLLWVIAGIGQSFVEIPIQNIIADTIPLEEQGKAYGSHFAWSHLWWAFAYPLAGYLGGNFTDANFLYGGLIALLLLGIISTFSFLKLKNSKNNITQILF